MHQRDFEDDTMIQHSWIEEQAESARRDKSEAWTYVKAHDTIFDCLEWFDCRERFDRSTSDGWIDWLMNWLNEYRCEMTWRVIADVNESTQRNY